MGRDSAFVRDTNTWGVVVGAIEVVVEIGSMIVVDSSMSNVGEG